MEDEKFFKSIPKYDILIRGTYGYWWAKLQRAQTKNSEGSLGDLWNCFWQYSVLILAHTVWRHPYPYSTPQELSNDMLHLIFYNIYRPFLNEKRKISSSYITILELKSRPHFKIRHRVASIIATGTFGKCKLCVWVRMGRFSRGKRRSITFELLYK